MAQGVNIGTIEERKIKRATKKNTTMVNEKRSKKSNKGKGNTLEEGELD